MAPSGKRRLRKRLHNPGSMMKSSAPNGSPNMQELWDHFRRRQNEMIADIRELVELESPSHDKAAVDRLGKMIGEKFSAIGGSVRFHRAKTFGDHLQCDFAGDRGKPILLLGHFDTVWDIGTLVTMAFHLSGGRAWGPGVLDMKCGIVMMLWAIAALREMHGKLPRPVTVVLVTDEEVGSESSRAITEAIARKSAAVLVLEPAQGMQGALKTARKGVGDYAVKVSGVASHSGVDFEKGQSAIIELSRQILDIARFTDLKRGITVNPGVIRGGTRTNVIAAEAFAEVDVRIARMRDAAIVERKFRSLRPHNKKCSLEITGGGNRPPMERTAGIAALFGKAQQLAADIGWKLDEAATGGGSDGNFTAALGLPTLDGLGGVGEGAHARNESIVVDELPRRTALIAALLSSI
jgi:glutamate carboxypeptidase